MDFETQFREIYTTLGLLTSANDDKGTSLHRSCKFSNVCWVDEKKCVAQDIATWHRISLPWVGPAYKKTGALVVGVNMYEFGGLKAWENLLNEARSLFRNGKRKSHEYRWGLFLHRVACYGIVVGEVMGGIQEVHWGADGFPDNCEAELGFDYIALTNHVKCSPADQKTRSRPFPTMWQTCGPHIFAEELRVLNPRILIIVQEYPNFEMMAKSVFGGSSAGLLAQGSVTCHRIQFQKRSIPAIVMPHPSQGTGAKAAVLGDLRKVLEFAIST